MQVQGRHHLRHLKTHTYLYKKLLVLRLEGEREPVDDGAEDLEELPHAIEVLRLVDEPASKSNELNFILIMISVVLTSGRSC